MHEDTSIKTGVYYNIFVPVGESVTLTAAWEDAEGGPVEVEYDYHDGISDVDYVETATTA